MVLGHVVSSHRRQLTRLLKLDIFTQVYESDRQTIVESVLLDVELLEDLSQALRALQPVLELSHLIAHHIHLLDENVVLADE